MNYFLGIDPGKKGGFVLLDELGNYVKSWRMPSLTRDITSQSIANIYYNINSVTNEIKPTVFLERIFTAPFDGRVGLMTYAQEAGRLEMCALWRWPIHLVHPKTWMSKIHMGLPKKLEAKEKSLHSFMLRFPYLCDKGSDFWPESSKKPLDGLVDAALIAEYGRIWVIKEQKNI